MTLRFVAGRAGAEAPVLGFGLLTEGWVVRALSVALALALTLALLQMPACADAGSLAGKWRVVAEERGGQRREVPSQLFWTMEFLEGGKLVYTKRSRRQGTWIVQGHRLTTHVEGQTRTVTFTLAGDKLTIVNADRQDWRLHLVRDR